MFSNGWDGINIIYAYRPLAGKGGRLTGNNSKNILESSNSFDDSIALWIDPNGKAIGTLGSHTNTIIEIPETFGLSQEEADRIFTAKATQS